MAAGDLGTAGAEEEKETHQPYSHRVPSEKPPFTLADVRRAIPPHCFRRSLLLSTSYLLRDLAVSALLFYLAATFLPRLPPHLRLLGWPLYWATQGVALTALWALAHECGHHAFSDHGLLDDALGFALHSSLLVPYFSFKHSHRRHHANTCSMDADEVYLPCTLATLPWPLRRLLLDNPPGRLIYLAAVLTLGWPAYLAFNVSGRRYPRSRWWTSHFDPTSPLYRGWRERLGVVFSDAGCLAAWWAIARVAGATSWGWVGSLYGAPLLVANGMVVLVTYLQHTHVAVPRLVGEEWEWLRGSLCTVDRDYGGFLNAAMHHVADAHVLHHLFPSMPHYHAVEATRAARGVLGEYYRFDGTHIVKAAWRETKDCVFVEPDEGGSSGGLLWFRNKL